MITALPAVSISTVPPNGDYLKKDATRYSSRIGAVRLPGCSSRYLSRYVTSARMLKNPSFCTG